MCEIEYRPPAPEAIVWPALKPLAAGHSVPPRAGRTPTTWEGATIGKGGSFALAFRNLAIIERSNAIINQLITFSTRFRV